MADEMALQRERMVREQIIARGVHDPRVIGALLAIPRERFVSESERESAYTDHPLPIGAGQTISQPYIVAATLAALSLEGNERVLEIGTGSGYVAALLTRLAREVYSVERVPQLAASAAARLQADGYGAHVRCADGTLGWPEHAPYDAIAVAAAGPSLPEPLIQQLAPGGRLVIPLRTGKAQHLVRVVRRPDGQTRQEVLEEVRFVPLIGEFGE